MKTTRPSKVGLAKKRLRRIDDKMQQHIDQGGLPGTLTLVARRGKVAHLETRGLRNLKTNQPVTEDTIFRIYSMTKPIASLALLMLYEEGHFQLFDPVSKFIPAFKDLKVFIKPGFAGWQLAELDRPITIWHLLTHTAGLSYGFHEDSPIEKLYNEQRLFRVELSLEEMVDGILKLPLYFQPGTAWRYSVATDVVGYLVELISGQSLDSFLHERIFEPLGMIDTDFYVPKAKIDRFAELYEPAEGGGIKPMSPNMSRGFVKKPRNLSGGGGLVSTAADYLRFCEMMLNYGKLDGTRLVSRKTIELMTANHMGPQQMPLTMGPSVMSGYGFGLGVRVLVNPAQSQTPGSVGEHGWGGLASTYYFVDPQEEMIGIVMTQLIPPESHPIRMDFRVLAYQSIVD